MVVCLKLSSLMAFYGFKNKLDFRKIVYHTSTSSLSCENAGGAGSCKRNACECDLKLGLTMFQYAHEE